MAVSLCISKRVFIISAARKKAVVCGMPDVREQATGLWTKQIKDQQY
jgi:hypothetical protein